MPVKERYGEGKDEETAETALTDAGTQQGNGSLQSEMLFLSADLLALSPFFFLLGGGGGGGSVFRLQAHTNSLKRILPDTRPKPV